MGSLSLLFMYGQTFALISPTGGCKPRKVGNWFVSMTVFEMLWKQQTKGLTISGFLNKLLSSSSSPHKAIDPPHAASLFFRSPSWFRCQPMRRDRRLRLAANSPKHHLKLLQPWHDSTLKKRGRLSWYQRQYKFWIPSQYKKLGGVYKGGSDMFTSLLGIFWIMQCHLLKGW